MLVATSSFNPSLTFPTQNLDSISLNPYLENRENIDNNSPFATPTKRRRTAHALSASTSPRLDLLSPEKNIKNIGSQIKASEKLAAKKPRSASQIKRTILRQTEAKDGFFIEQSSEDKLSKTYDASLIKEHAFLRIQMFAVISVAIHGRGLRSDPSLKRDISIDIGPAYLQIGQGSAGYQAAHCNANAGYTDNLRETLLDQVVKEHQVTPKAQRILKCKGFSETEFESFKQQQSEQIHEEFDRIWPINKKRPHSILTNTRLDEVLNSTTEVPQSVNLSCDKGLEESLRPFSEKLYTRLFFAEITPQQACEEYRNYIVDYFKKLETHLTKRVEHLKNYQQMMDKELEGFETLTPEEALTRLKELQTSLAQINRLDTGEEKVLSRAKIKRNHKFLQTAIYSLAKDHDYLMSLKKFVANSLNALKQEVSTQLDRFYQYHTFCKLEKEGSNLPDFTTLFGSYNEALRQRELHAADLEDMQARFLKPKTPQKPPLSELDLSMKTPPQTSSSRR